ncbi:MAG: hypothetical protein ABIK83_01940 [Candidatus Zixiibacteriota bacterium]
MDRNFLNFPIFRLGSILKANATLTDTTSRRVAREIKNRGELFLAGMLRSLNESGGSDIRPCSQHGIRLRSAEPPIVDFPPYDLELNGFKIRSRTSLTVCMFVRRSKLWTRISVLRYAGRPAYGLSGDAVHDIRDQAEKAMVVLLQSIQSEYERILRDLSIADVLSRLYDFWICGLNTSDPVFEQLRVAISRHEIPNLKSALQNEKFFRSMSELLSFVLRERGVIRDQSFDLTQLGETRSTIQKSRDSNGKPEAVVLTAPRYDSTSINCLCYNTSDDMTKKSPAEVATARLVEEFAESY